MAHALLSAEEALAAEVLTTGEAAQILGVTHPTVRRYLLEGRVRGWQLPSGQWRVVAGSLLALRQAGEVAPETLKRNSETLETEPETT